MVIGRAKEYGREERPNRKCKTNEAYSHILQPLKNRKICARQSTPGSSGN